LLWGKNFERKKKIAVKSAGKETFAMKRQKSIEKG